MVEGCHLVAWIGATEILNRDVAPVIRCRAAERRTSRTGLNELRRILPIL